jgi:hypothetical protein
MPTIEDKDKIAIDREDVESIAFQFATYHEDKNGRYVTDGGLSDISFLFKILGWKTRHYYEIPNPPEKEND